MNWQTLINRLTDEAYNSRNNGYLLPVILTNKKNTMTTQSNSLLFKTDKVHNGKHIFVKIRLNDQCKNGHQDFAITALVYEANKPKTDRYLISGGCCHDEILKAFPEFKIFVNLHLCDYKGIPMHPSANMHYHLKSGLNRTKPDSTEFKKEFCDYYRVTSADFDVLNGAYGEIHLYLLLQSLGIISRWENEATEAIKLLEEMTDTKFLVDSTRTNLVIPSAEKIDEEISRLNNGYYSPEKIAEREAEKMQSIIDKLANDRDKEILKANNEYLAKVAILKVGGNKALENSIFYTHTNELSLNWRKYGEELSQKEIEHIINNIELPEGIKVTISKNK